MSGNESADAPPEEKEDGESCSACMSRPRTVRNLPCGHAMLCELCTIRVIDVQEQSCRCPNARCAVTSVVFLPSHLNAAPRVKKMRTFQSAPQAPDGQGGTGNPRYRVIQERESMPGAPGQVQAFNYLAICKMPEYANKCFEELRYEDYNKGNKGSHAPTSDPQNGGRTFSSLIEFLHAMLDSEFDEVATAARAKLERWGQPTPAEEGEEEAEPAYPIDEQGHSIVPEGVTFLGDNAFFESSNLITITLPDDLTTIGVDAFFCCSSLANVTLPDNLTTIGDGAFYGCLSLATITLPDNLTTIGNEVFSGCSSLANVSLPDNLTMVGGRAFHACSSLANVSLPDNLTTIGEEVFYGCSSLANVTLPDSLTTIGDGAFYGCYSLATITLPDSLITIGNRAFQGCSYSLTTITLPDSLTTIGNEAFQGCSSLTTITFPDSVTTIGTHAFRDCPSLDEQTKDAIRAINPVDALFWLLKP